MPLSKKKQEKADRQKRVDYVMARSYTGWTHKPFMDVSWDDAALRYIETGDESLKQYFPSTPRNKKESK